MIMSPLMMVYFQVILLDPPGKFKVANVNIKFSLQPIKSVWGLVEYVHLNSQQYLEHHVVLQGQFFVHMCLIMLMCSYCC